MQEILKDTVYHISFSLAGLVFSLVLYVLLLLLGIGKEHRNHRFQVVTMSVVIGNIISIADYVLRFSGLIKVPAWACLLSFLIVYQFNTILTYYVAKYIEAFFELTNRNKYFKQFNAILLICGIFVSSMTFFRFAYTMDDNSVRKVLPMVLYMFLAYGIELYYVFYSIIVFVINKNDVEKRTRITAMLAFTVAALGIILEIGNPTGVLMNYFGAVLGTYIFYIGIETPDYKALTKTVEELSLARENADAANRAKSEFLANMSHEIRTPINAVIGMNEMIIRESEDDEIIGYARNVEGAGKTLLSIINDILDFSKIEAGQLDIIEAPYRFSSLINDIVNMTYFRAEAKGLEFEVDVDPELPDGLFGDEIRIRQVMVNVLSNAVKYTHSGSVKLSFKGERNGATLNLEMTVRDTGVGIKKEDINNLFDKFNRLDLSKNKNIEGTGLGLAITKNLIDMMNGTIEVESEYGVGSEFRVKIPQGVVIEDEVGNYKERFEAHSRENKKYKEQFRAPEASILVVDDTSVNLTVVKALLKETQMNIETALSGDEALKFTAKKAFDIILMDYRMPIMDGTMTMEKIKTQDGGLNHDTPIICLTADAVLGAREKYLEVGFSDYLTKPVVGTDLEDMMLKFLPEDKIIIEEQPESQEETKGDNVATQRNAQNESSDVKENSFESESFEKLKTIYENEDELFLIDALNVLEDGNLLMEVVTQLYESINDNADEVEYYFAEKDYKNYTVKVHAMKSSTALIGATNISNKAKELEMCGNTVLEESDENRVAEAKERIENETMDLLAKYRCLKDIFSTLFEKKVENLPLADKAFMREFYEAAYELAGSYDDDSMNALIATLDNYSLSEEDAKKVKTLKKAVKNADWKLVEDTALQKI
ncbi:MAG: response regulator [Lachnospiraceae bacterium]|nr:response regulator [Lachnospiraceae bacterium]